MARSESKCCLASTLLLCQTMEYIQNVDDLTSLFHLPVSVEAFQQFQHMEALFQNLTLVEPPDTWLFPANSTLFRVNRAYRMLLGDSIPIPGITWLCTSCNQLKHKSSFGSFWMIGWILEECYRGEISSFRTILVSCVTNMLWNRETTSSSIVNLHRPAGRNYALIGQPCHLGSKIRLLIWSTY